MRMAPGKYARLLYVIAWSSVFLYGGMRPVRVEPHEARYDVSCAWLQAEREDGKASVSAPEDQWAPDYEEEKLRFQRGTEPYYMLTGYDTGNAAAIYHDRQAATRPASVDEDSQPEQEADTVVALHRALVAAAMQGDSRAAIFLGIMSEQGRGTEQDYERARQWYLGALAAGKKTSPDVPQWQADAQFMLGLLYLQGKGVTPDDTQAMAWFRQAAALGSRAAQVDLGWMYEYHRGVPQDFVQARYWYRKAARRGDTLGQYDLATLFYEGKGVPQSRKMARYWLLKAAERDAAPAQYSLGVIALGDAVKQHAAEAYRWFRLAQQRSYPGATQAVRLAQSGLRQQDIIAADAWVLRWNRRHAHRCG